MRNIKKIVTLGCIAVCAAVMLCSCGNKKALASISLASPITLQLGESKEVEITGILRDGTTVTGDELDAILKRKGMHYESSSDNVASIDQNGLLMDDIADSNPFVQNLFKRSHKKVKQERPAREKPAADTNAAKATQTLAAPAPEPTAPQSETFNVSVTPAPAQPAASSAPASAVAPAVPETVDTVDFVDDIPIDIEFDDTEADVQNEQPDQSVQNDAVPAQPVASQNVEAVPASNEPTAQPENVPAQEPTAFAAHLDASPDTKEKESEKNPGYHEPVGEMVIPDKKPEQLETPAWPDGMNGPKFTESVVAYGSLPRKVGAEEANVFLFARYNTDKDMGSYGLCIDMGKDFVQSSKCGKANNPEEYALMGAIEMLLALDEHTVRDVVIYTEPVVAKIMNENANRLLDGKSPVRRKYIELAWKAMTKVSVRFVTTKVNSEYGKLALATAKYLAFCER